MTNPVLSLYQETIEAYKKTVCTTAVYENKQHDGKNDNEKLEEIRLLLDKAFLLAISLKTDNEFTEELAFILAAVSSDSSLDYYIKEGIDVSH